MKSIKHFLARITVENGEQEYSREFLVTGEEYEEAAEFALDWVSKIIEYYMNHIEYDKQNEFINQVIEFEGLLDITAGECARLRRSLPVARERTIPSGDYLLALKSSARPSCWE